MVSNITDLFKPASEEPEGQDNEKLHDLYWNRAELKKEFAALREEKYRLKERVEQEKGATARVQQKMNHLESLLLDRDWVHNVVVFYQFRRLAAHCHAKLQRFAEELKQQREKRIHGKVLEAWKEQVEEEVAVIEAHVGEIRLQTQLLEDQLVAERHKVSTMGRVAKMMRGKALEADLDTLAARVEQGQDKERQLLSELETARNQEPPSHQGLDIATKRSINYMILSFAQQLFVHFSDDNLAELARESSEKSVGAVNYGSKSDCDELIELLERRWESADKLVDSPDILKRRAELIAKHAIFRAEDDAVPVPGSVATLYIIHANGTVRERDANLLGENFFGVARVLSR